MGSVGQLLNAAMKLEPPTTHYLNAAQGWLELGNAAEASAELELIAPALQTHPEVLEMRWQICAQAQKWQQCIVVAEEMLAVAPGRVLGWIHRSYALHELKRTREALEALLPALVKFPKDWLVQYNLACYCCRLNELARARHFLEQACDLGNAKEIKAMALKDTDLLELWEG